MIMGKEIERVFGDYVKEDIDTGALLAQVSRRYDVFHLMVMDGRNESVVKLPKWRKLMGATDPSKAEEGTIRRKYAESVQHNAVHGSDSDDNALNEIFFYFSAREIVNAGGDIYQLHDMK